MTLDDFIDNGVKHSNGTYTLTGNITVNERLIITGNVTLNLNGHNITCTVDGDDYAFCVQDGGKFTLTGNGEIRANGGAGGIEVEGGSFTMNGGKIVVSNGRGVQLDGSDCSFTMSGGEISVTGGKDGVYNNGGTVTMSGGTINVTGTDSKGINNTVGTVTMSGGTINVTGTATEKIIGIYNEQNTVNITTTNKPKITVTNTGGGEIYTIYNEDTVKINGKEAAKILGIGITFDDDGNVFYEVTSANQLNALTGETGEGAMFKLGKNVSITDVQTFVAANTNFAGTFLGDGYLVKSRNFFYPVTVPETLKITYADENSVATFAGVTYYKQGASLTISAKDNGTVIKLSDNIADNNVNGTATVTVGNKTVNINNADVNYFYSVTVPTGFEIDDSAVGAGYKYSVSGTTYYAKDTTLTLKVKQGYVVDGDVTVVSAGGDTVLQGDGGSYTFTVGGVTEITGTLKGELSMAYYQITGGTTTYYFNENGKIFSDAECNTEVTNSGFTVDTTKKTVTVSANALSAYKKINTDISITDAKGNPTNAYKFAFNTDVAVFGSNITETDWKYDATAGTLTALTVKGGQSLGFLNSISDGFYVDYQGHIRYSTAVSSSITITIADAATKFSGITADNWTTKFSVKGLALKLVDNPTSGVPYTATTSSNTLQFYFDVSDSSTIKKATTTPAGWAETTNNGAQTFSYKEASTSDGYNVSLSESTTTFTYNTESTGGATLYELTVTGGNEIDKETLNTNADNYFSILTTPSTKINLKEAFITAIGGGTAGKFVSVTSTTPLGLADNIDDVALTLSDNNSKVNVSAGKATIDGGYSFYGAADFAIGGLASGVTLDTSGNLMKGNDNVGSIKLDGTKFTITLDGAAIETNKNVTFDIPSGSAYSVFYVAGQGIESAESTEDPKVSLVGNTISYTAAKTKAGYSQQVNNFVLSGANSGGENFNITGLTLPDGYTGVNVVDGNIVATATDKSNVKLGTVSRIDGTEGETKTVKFQVSLEKDAFDTSSGTAIDFITTDSNVSFELVKVGDITISETADTTPTTLTKDGDTFTYTGGYKNECFYSSTEGAAANSKAHYVYQPATDKANYPQFTITGLTVDATTPIEGTDVANYITVENGEVTIKEAALGSEKPNITFASVDGYAKTTLTKIVNYDMVTQGTASDTITKVTGEDDAISYTYTTGAQAAGYYYDETAGKYTYQPEVKAKTFTITGVDLSSLFTGETTTVDVSDTSKALISVDANNNVTIGTNAVTDVTKAEITFNGEGFTLASIAGETIVTKSATPTLTKNEGADNSYTYSTGTQDKGFILKDGKYVYQEKIETPSSFTVTGLTGITETSPLTGENLAKYITVSNDNKVTIGIAAITGELSGASITFTGDGYELVSIAGKSIVDEGAKPSLKNNGGGSYTYNTGTISEGFVNNSGTYTYQSQVAGTEITISGLNADAFTGEITSDIENYITVKPAADGEIKGTITLTENILPAAGQMKEAITVFNSDAYSLVLPGSLMTATATTGTFETTDGKTFTLIIGGTPAHYNADGIVVQATGQGEVITLTASAAIESLLNTNFTVKKKDDGTYYIYKDGETGEGKELFTYKYDATATTPYQVKVATSVLEALPEGKYIKINTITSASGTNETVKNVGSLTWLDSNFATDHRTSKQEAIDVLTEEDKTSSFTVANVDDVAVGTFKKALANLDWYNQVYPYQVTHTAKSGGQNFQLSNLNAELIGKTFYVSGTSTDRIHEIRQDNASGTLIAVVTNGSILLSSNEQITLAKAAFKSTDATASNEDRTITLIRSNDGFAHVITTGTVSAGTLPISTNSAAKMLSPNLEKAKDDNGNEISGSYVYTSSGKIAHITRSAVGGVNNLAATYQPSTITTMTLSGLSPNLATGGIGLDVLGYVEFNSLDTLKEYMTLSFSTGSGTNTVKHVALASGYYKYTGPEDITLDSTLDITDANVILDLSGKTINYAGKGEDDQAVRVWENGHLTINNGTITATGADGIYVQPNTGEANADGTPRASLILNNVNVSGTTYGVVGNGTCHGTAITINNSKITGGNTGIYHPQEGTLVINGTSEITGTTTGIEIRSGELYITGKEVKVTGGTGNYEVNSNGNGTTTANAAIAIAQHSTNKNLDINIEGGTFTATTALSLANPNGNGTSTVEVNIQGGNFNGNIVNKYADKPVNIGGETTCSGTLTVEGNAKLAIDPAATLASNSSYSSYVAQESIEALKNIIAPQQEETGAVVVTKGEESGYIVKVNAKALKGATGNIKLVSSDGYSLALGEDVATAPFVVESEATFTVTDAKTLKFKSPSYKAWYKKNDNGEYVPQAAVEGKEFTFSLTSDGTFTTADNFIVVTDETRLISTIYNADDVTVSMDGTVTPNTGAKSLFTFTVTGDNTDDNDGTYGDITAYGFEVEKAFLTAMGTADNTLTLAPPAAADGETAPTTTLALAQNVGVESVGELNDGTVLTKQITGQNAFVYTAAVVADAEADPAVTAQPAKLSYNSGSTPAYYDVPTNESADKLSITYHATIGGTEAFTLTGALNGELLASATLTLTDKTVTVDGTEKTYKVLKAGETVIGAFGTGDSENVFYLAKDAFDAKAATKTITLEDKTQGQNLYSLSSKSIPTIDGLLPSSAAVSTSLAKEGDGYKYQGAANGDYVSVSDNVATFTPSDEVAKSFTISGLKDGLIPGSDPVDKIKIDGNDKNLSELITVSGDTVTLKNAALLPDTIATNDKIIVTPGTGSNVTKLEFSGFGTGDTAITAGDNGNFTTSGEFTAPKYAAVFDTGEGLTRTCTRGTVGGEEFTFTGVKDDLTFVAHTPAQDEPAVENALVYDIKSGTDTVGTITVAVANNAITGYTFDLKPGAIDVGTSEPGTVSVESSAPFDFTITPETIFTGGWRDNQNGTYSYVTDGYQGVAIKNDQESTNGKISYTFTNSVEQPQQFTITLGQHDEEGFFAPRTDAASVQWGFGDIPSVAIEITHDKTTGHIETASATLNSGSLPANGFSEDTEIKLDWTTDSSYGEAKPTTSVKIDETYLATLTTSTPKACKFEPQTTEGDGGTEGTTYKGTTYQFTAKETTAGYKQNYEETTGEGGNTTQTPTTVSFTAASGGDTFTITNLASDLTVVYDKTDKQYEIYASNQVTTGQDGTTTVTQDAKLLGTIAETKNEETNCYDVEILDAAALFTTAPSEAFTVTLTDTDDKHDVHTYSLKFAEDLTKEKDAEDAKFEASTVTEETTTYNCYKYTIGKTGWKFTPNASEQTANNKLTTSYTFSPKAEPTNIKNFYIIGLKENLTDLKLDLSTGEITGKFDNAEVNLGKYDATRKTITLNEQTALPLDATTKKPADGTEISCDVYSLDITTDAKAYEKSEETYSFSNGIFTYTAAGNTEGYEYNYDSTTGTTTRTYHAQSGAQSFELKGFNTSEITKITKSGSSPNKATFADITKDLVVDIFTVQIDGTTGTVTLLQAAFDSDTTEQTITLTDNKEGDGVDYKLTSTLSTTGTQIAASTTVGSDLIYTAAGIGVYYTTTDTSVKRNAQQGCEQFKLELPNNKTGFYVDSEGNIKATENDTEVLATITFDDVTVEAGKGVTEATTLKKPKTVAVTAAAFSATNDEVKLTNVTENLGVTLALAEGLKSAAETVAAKFGTGDDDKFTYTGAHDSAYYTLGEGSLSVKYTAEATGAQFKLTGFDTAKVTSLFVDNTSGKIYIGSDADGTEIGAVTISGSTGTVTLNETAFTYATDAATGITLVDLDKDDGVTFSFGQGDLTQESAATITEGFSFDNGTYTYTASGKKTFYTTGTPTTADKQTSTTFTRTAQTDGQQFTISGLNADYGDTTKYTLSIDSGTIKATPVAGTEGTEVTIGTLGEVSGNKTLTLTNAAALVAGNIVLTNVAIGTSGAPEAIDYKLAFGGEFSDTAADGKVQVIANGATAPTEGNKFQKSGDNFTYQTEHGSAYVQWDANGADGTGATEKTYTASYTAEENNFDTITFTGLSYSGEDFIVGENTAVTYSNNVFTLTSAVLPTTGDITISAKKGNTEESSTNIYTMAVTGVATKAYTPDTAAETAGNTWSNGVYTSPAFEAYYTYADSDTTSTSKITAHAAIPATEVFTVNKQVGTEDAAGLGSYYVVYDAENKSANIFASEDDATKAIGTITFTPATSGGKDTYAVNFTKAHIESQLDKTSATVFTATAKDDQKATVNFMVSDVSNENTPTSDEASLKAKAESTTDAEYTGGHTNAYWTVATNSYTYTPAVADTVFFTIGGLSSNTDLSKITVTPPTAPDTNYTIALTKDYFTVGTPVTITAGTASATITSITDGGDNYLIQKGGTVPQVPAAFTSTDSGATYNFKAAYPAEHIVADGNNYTLTAADDSKALTFTISGLNSDYADETKYTLSVDGGTIKATPKEGEAVTIGTFDESSHTLTLNQAALSDGAKNGSEAIELTTTSTANFSLAINKTDGGTYDLTKPDAVNKLAYAEGTGYTYTAGYVGEYFAKDESKTDGFKYTYTAPTSTGQFTISGDALKAATFTELTTKDNANALDTYLTVDEDGKVTNVGMLKDEPDANDTVSIAVAKGTYTLNNPHAIEPTAPAFVENNILTANAFDYKASTSAGYAEEPKGTFTYQAAGNDTLLFTISGLPTTITALTVDGEKLMSGGKEIGTFSGKEIKLNSNALPTTVDTTTPAIKLENNSDQYTLGVDSTVTQEAFTPVKDGTYTFTGDATNGFTFSTPAYQAYYVAGDNTITPRPALDAQTFTITVTEGDFNATGLTLGEPSKSDEGYTFPIEGFGKVTATATAGTGDTADTFTFTAVTPDKAFIGRLGQGGTLTISGGTFSATDLPEADVNTGNATFSESTYTAAITKADAYTVNDDKTTITHDAQEGGEQFKLSGDLSDGFKALTTVDTTYFNVDNGKVYLKAAAFSAADKAITLTNLNGANFAFATDNKDYLGEYSNNNRFTASFDGSGNGKLAYKAGGLNDGLTFSGTKATYKAGTGGQSFTISGLKSDFTDDGLSIENGVIYSGETAIAAIDSSNKVTLKKDALPYTSGTVKFEDGTDTETYSLALDKSLLSATTTAGSVSAVEDSTVTYVTKKTSDYYTATADTTNSFDYVAAVGGDKLIISGLSIDPTKITTENIGDYISIVEGENNAITVTINSKDVLTEDTGTEVTLSTLEGYTLTLAASDDVLKPTTETTGKWTGSGSAYTYGYTTTTKVFAVDNNKLVYSSSSTNEGTAFTLSGLTSEPTEEQITVDNDKKTVTFNESLGDVTVADNTGKYSFTAAEGMKLTGSTEADTLTATGSNVLLNGDAGNDTFDFSKATDGVLAFSDGNDTVEYSANFKIDFGDKLTGEKTPESIATLNGSDVVFTVGENSLTVKNARGQDISVTYGDGNDTVVNLSAKDFSKMLTYNSGSTAVTLNGAATSTKAKFEGSLLNSNDYKSTVVTITAAAGANNGAGIYINGNAKNNVIYSKNVTNANAAGNTLDGGAGNDTLNGSAGKDLFIYKAGEGNDTIIGFTANDTLQIAGATEGTLDISGNNIVIKIGSNTVTLKDAFGEEDSLTLNNVVAEGGGEVSGVTGLTLNHTTLTISDGAGNVTLTSGLKTYEVTEDDKKIDASLVSASVATISVASAADGLVIENFKPTFKLTGIATKDIYKSNYTNGTIELQLEDGAKKVTINTTTNKLIVDGTTYYVGKDALYNASLNAARVTLTSGATEFTATGDSYLTSTGAVSIDGSNTNGVDITLGDKGGTVTASEHDDKFTGGEGNDTFIYSGGDDTIASYGDGDVIKLDKSDLLNFANVSYAGNDVIISGDDGNSLTLIEGNDTRVKFNVGGSDTYYTFTGDGEFNASMTAITLSANHDNFNLPDKTSDIFSKVASIYAGQAAPGAEITANTEIASYITAGNIGLTLVGGNGNDTLQDGTSNSSLKGGEGSDTFIIGGGDDTIVDYTTGDDQISLKTYSMTDITGVALTDNGPLQLVFTSGETSHTLNLEGTFTSDSTIAINGNNYTFGENIVNDKANYSVTLLAAGNVDLSSQYNDSKVVMANNGGTITAGTTAATLGGKDVSLVGDKASDTFVYAGGNVTISGYGNAGTDKISLAGGYQITDIGETDDDDKKTLLTVSDKAGNTGTILLEDTTAKSVRVVTSSGTKTFQLTLSTDNIYNSATETLATAVTLKSTFGDFGAIRAKDDHETTKGSEYWSNLYTIEAAQDDSFIVGNMKANKIIAKGGNKNVLIGGLGCDTFIFSSGGGVIRDFGISTTKQGDTLLLAKNTTQVKNSSYVEFNRMDPTSYYANSDTLQINGKVVEIALKGYKNNGADGTLTSKNPNNTFTAYVTYTSDADGEDYTVALDNIVKKPTKTSTDSTKVVYQTDVAAAKTLKIYDTSSGEMAKLNSTAITDLLRSLDDADSGTSIYSSYNDDNHISGLTNLISNNGLGATLGYTGYQTEFTNLVETYGSEKQED